MEDRIIKLEAHAFRTGSDLADIRQTVGSIDGLVASFGQRHEKKLDTIAATQADHTGRLDRIEDLLNQVLDRLPPK
ncbi:hypothetical protein [Actinomadura atramentaria]|uniref:hypothetical protein n=1 Tax=Actinomadura atramentaria TaxID=1990 RepID=UPI0003A77F06|nr:hypothetical protein [Actinomadura atramentaria]